MLQSIKTAIYFLAQIVIGLYGCMCACKSPISAFFPGTCLRIFRSPSACGWFSDSARTTTGLSWQPVACCEKRWCQMTSFWLFITPRWVMFPKLDRLVWFIITCPSGLHFCCICFWDSIHSCFLQWCLGETTCWPPLLWIMRVGVTVDYAVVCAKWGKHLSLWSFFVKPEHLKLARWAHYRNK